MLEEITAEVNLADIAPPHLLLLTISAPHDSRTIFCSGKKSDQAGVTEMLDILDLFVMLSGHQMRLEILQALVAGLADIAAEPGAAGH